MTQPQPSMIITGSARDKAAAAPARTHDAEWAVLGGVGLMFAILGLMDLALVWYPLSFGSPEWEFTSMTQSLNGLPVPVLGLALVLVSGVARRSQFHARAAAVALWLLALAVIGGAVVYATTVPMAFGKINNPVVRLGLFKAVSKTAVQCVLYPLLFAWAGFKGWTGVRPVPRAV